MNTNLFNFVFNSLEIADYLLILKPSLELEIAFYLMP